MINLYADDINGGWTEFTQMCLGIFLVASTVVGMIYFFIQAAYADLEYLNSENCELFDKVGFILERLRLDTRYRLFYNFWFTIRRVLLCLVVLFYQGHVGF